MLGPEREQGGARGSGEGKSQRAGARDSVREFGAQEIGPADESRGVRRGRPQINLARRGHLLQFARAHQGNAVGKRHGFVLIVRHEDEGDPHVALERLQFGLHLAAKIGVERGEGLIEQQEKGPVHQGARQRHALLLAAGEFRGSRARPVRHFHHGQGLSHARPGLFARDAANAQAVGHVFLDAQVREERVVLENGVHPAAIGRQYVQPLLLHPDFAAVGLFEAGDQTEEGGFARAAFAQDGEELTGGDVQRHAIQHGGRCEAFAHRANFEQRSHGPDFSGRGRWNGIRHGDNAFDSSKTGGM